MDIVIPERLLQKIDENTEWGANVRRIKQNVGNYFTLSPFFFPEYTIHGMLHINNVLDICDHLIPDSCIEYLTSRDIALLVISVIMHDIGMFIEKDGVYELLFGQFSNSKISDLDTQTWKELWEAYINKVRRYPDKKLVKSFGTAIQIQKPPSDMTDLKHIDILIYGDFLRQYHPRLSHQIIEKGFLGTETIDVLRDTGIDPSIRSLIGLLARSHGMDIRDTNTYLRNKFVMPSKPKGIPIFYLMALLRIADYLDAGQGRAPRELQGIKKQVSSISEAEWAWNQSIDYQDYLWEDNEVLNIHSEPENTVQFNDVKRWLNSVQKELDTCWAVLGEHYGIEKKWLLSIRRINSNITNPKTKEVFEKSFLTRATALSVNPDIIKLLIGPLYDNNPSCGLRELIQNAVDACREREAIEKANGNVNYSGEVVVKVCTKEKVLIVEDNGIGMTGDTLVDYYLMAGSSYRYSDNWANDFIVNEENTIPRTGKFGIGALAAFLLGPNMQIKTRYIKDECGLILDIDLKGSDFNVNKDNSLEAGTQIKINLTDRMLEKITELTLSIDDKDNRIIAFHRNINIDLNDEFKDEVVEAGKIDKAIRYHWYYHDNPRIKYVVDEMEKINADTIPDKNNICPGWFLLENTSFKSYKWSYHNKNYNYYDPLTGDTNRRRRREAFFYNGILVPTVNMVKRPKIGIRLPNISIVDYDNLLKISLNRNSCKLPNTRELYIELYKYYIASLLICPIREISKGSLKSDDLIFYRDCFTIDNKYFLKISNISNFYGILNANFIKLRRDLFNYPFTKIRLEDMDAFANSWEKENISKIICNLSLKNKIGDEYQGIIEVRQKDHKFNSEMIDYIYNFTKSKMVVEYTIDHVFDYGLRDDLSKYYKDKIFKKNTENIENDDLMQVIEEYLHGDVWIPIDIKERKKKYKYAFKELDVYIIDNKREYESQKDQNKFIFNQHRLAAAPK